MRSKLTVYIILFVFLSLIGFISAKAIEAIYLSQYTCNFVYGAVITIYAIENWFLLMDLQNKYPPHEESGTDNMMFKATVVHLLSDNSVLSNENKRLKEQLEEITTKYNQIQENNSKSIVNWKEKWNLHHGIDNNSYPPLEFE